MSGTTLFVGNLAWTTEEAEVMEIFSSVAPVLKCTIPRGRSGRSRGFALVEYASPMDAIAAIQRLEGARSWAVGRRAAPPVLAAAPDPAPQLGLPARAAQLRLRRCPGAARRLPRSWRLPR